MRPRRSAALYSRLMRSVRGATPFEYGLAAALVAVAAVTVMTGAGIDLESPFHNSSTNRKLG